jgi:Na+:H+ antiporter, NhaA family
MAVFFMLVGLEIKREIVEGGLSRPSRAVLPLISRDRAWPRLP